MRTYRRLAVIAAVVASLAGCSDPEGPAAQQIVLDFSACPAALTPLWLAWQDGAGPWTSIAGTGGRYTVTINSDSAGLAFVVPSAFFTTLTAEYRTRAEWSDPAERCLAGTHALGGTAAGIEANEYGIVSIGGGRTAVPANGPFTVNDVSTGAHDLLAFAYRPAALGVGTSVLLRRNVTVGPGTNLGTLDFNAAEAFAPMTATVTVLGAAPSELLDVRTWYRLATGCEFAVLPPDAALPPDSSTTQVTGIPSAHQAAGDYHLVSVYATDASLNSARSVNEAVHALADRTLTLGPPLPPPTVAALAGPYLRLQASVVVPAEYQGMVRLSYQTPYVHVQASYAYLNTANVTLAMPDLSGVSGWQNEWAPAAAVTRTGTVMAWRETAGGLCQDNARYQEAWNRGSF